MMIKAKLYNLLVNKIPGISYRYHRVHDGSLGVAKVLSWAYLLWLNFAYYVLFMRFLGEISGAEIYERKRLTIDSSESVLHIKKTGISVESYVDKLKDYEVISFDIFDTLIFRPFSLPKDLFCVVGEGFLLLDFKDVRVKAENDARKKNFLNKGHTEVTLKDIYDNLKASVGGYVCKGQQEEIDVELDLCYANPFMISVWNKLVNMGKRIIVVSDMYLTGDVLEKLLNKNGYTGYEKLYISCEYGKSKANGELFGQVKSDYREKKLIHVGDNAYSDGRMAESKEIENLLYPRIDKNAKKYRAFDMSAMVGSAYRAIVSNHIYNGLSIYSMEYEYGFIYGGLFVLGYCRFIHDFCSKNNVDKLMFLSRDGDILKLVYEKMYPDDKEKLVYAYMSRRAATILLAKENRYDYFKRFIHQKTNQGYSLKKILKSMGLSSLESMFKIQGDMALTSENKEIFEDSISSYWDEVLSIYETNRTAAKKYYEDILSGAKRAVAIDIGWAGSGSMALSHLVEKVWDIPCKITGIVAGTNTIHNSEPDASEPFLQSGKLVSYMYSQGHNRDLLKKHDPGKDYNIYWELLLSSPTPGFEGFFEGRPDKDETGEYKYLEELDITLKFGEYDKNTEGIKEIQRGIMDFAMQYKEHFKNYPYMLNISGRDAYAPMLLAASHKERYLKVIAKKFSIEKNVV